MGYCYCYYFIYIHIPLRKSSPRKENRLALSLSFIYTIYKANIIALAAKLKALACMHKTHVGYHASRAKSKKQVSIYFSCLNGAPEMICGVQNFTTPSQHEGEQIMTECSLLGELIL